MVRIHLVALLGALLTDGGTGARPPDLSGQDAGGAASTRPFTPDAGTSAPRPIPAGGSRWPENLRPLATLDGPAVLAAHAALQHLLARLSREYGTACSASAKAMEVVVAEQGGLYFVRIDQHMEKCGWASPGFVTETDWFELYAVSPDGRVLARYPNAP